MTLRVLLRILMMSWLALLSLWWVFSFVVSSHARRQVASEFVPNPDTAALRVVTEHWLVWERTTVANPRLHVLRPTYHYYLQRNVGESAQLVYQYGPTVYERELVRGVLRDGTLVMEKIETALFLVKRDGTKIGVSGYPVRFGQDMAKLVAVYDDGVLVRAGDPNKYKPVYFIPWLANGLDTGKMFKVTDETGVYRYTSQVFRKGNVLALIGARLLLFNLADRTHQYFSFGSLPNWFPAINAFDGETVVFGTSNYGCYIGTNYDCYTKPAFNIKTGRQFLGVVAGSAIAVKNNIVYVLQERDDSCNESTCSLHLAAYDLHSTDDSNRILMDLKDIKPKQVSYILREDALVVWNGQQWKRIEWLPEKQLKN
jgi:hypothetical protein